MVTGCGDSSLVDALPGDRVDHGRMYDVAADENATVDQVAAAVATERKGSEEATLTGVVVRTGDAPAGEGWERLPH